jgi:hypothetical protein
LLLFPAFPGLMVPGLNVVCFAYWNKLHLFQKKKKKSRQLNSAPTAGNYTWPINDQYSSTQLGYN